MEFGAALQRTLATEADALEHDIDSRDPHIAPRIINRHLMISC